MKRTKSIVRHAMAMLLLLWPALSSADNRFYIPDFSITAGETTEVGIILENTDPLSAFQAYVTLPSELSVVEQYDETIGENTDFILSSRKSVNHELLSTNQGNGTYRLLANSMRGNYFSDNSGTLVTFKVKASEGFSGTVSINVTNVTFSDPSTKGYPMADSDCRVTVQAPVQPEPPVSGSLSFVPDQASTPTGGNEDHTHLFDGDADTKWCFSFSYGSYVIFHPTREFVANSYSITTCWDTNKYKSRNPKSWKIFGSTSATLPEPNSSSWTLIASVNDDKVLQGEDIQTYSFPLDVKGNVYTYFKLVIESTQGGIPDDTGCQMADFALSSDEVEFTNSLEAVEASLGMDEKDDPYTTLCDANLNTKWGFLTQTSNGLFKDVYIIMHQTESVKATAYSITTGRDSKIWTGRNPSSWTLYGSTATSLPAANSDTWVLLDDVENDDILQDVNNTEYRFSLPEEKAGVYNYYKWVIHPVKKDTYYQVGEFRIYGEPAMDADIPVSAISLSTTSKELEVGGSFTLTATVTPDNATNTAVAWASSNTNVATVSAEGKVTAVAAGSAVITATAAGGSQISASCNITVVAPNTPHTHDFSTTDNGDGTHTIVCAGCDFSETTGHTYVNGICSGCGAKEQSDIEPGTDITAYDNIIYLNPVDATAGSSATLCFSMKNTAEIQTIGIIVSLPEGISVAEDEYGQIIELADDRLTTVDRNGNLSHTLSSNYIDGEYRIGILGNAGKAFVGNDGPLFTMDVNIGDMEDGVYNLILSNMTLTDTSNNTVNVERVVYPITVKKYMPGDANGDGSINMADANMVVNRFLGKPTPSIKESAADVNGDGSINMADANAIVNIFLGK